MLKDDYFLILMGFSEALAVVIVAQGPESSTKPLVHFPDTAASFLLSLVLPLSVSQREAFTP